MYEHFTALTKEKQEAIINAAMMEFSSKGYVMASTNVIIATAGISKGALYHYFKSKEDLFSYLCGYVFDIVVREYYDKIPHANGDFLERLREASRLKQSLYERHPFIFEFAKRLTQEPPGVLGEDATRQMRETTSIGYGKIMENLDRSLFRSDMPPDKVIEMIMWSIEGYGNRVMAQMADIKSEQLKDTGAGEELDAYLGLLRRAYYTRVRQ